MNKKYCVRCDEDMTYDYTYYYFCENCGDRVYGHIPDYIPDEQVERYRRLKNV
jgi:hypothetical protein